MVTDKREEHEQCRRLLEAWHLGKVTSIERQLVGATNRVYRVEASAGVSCLRIYRRANRALAEREHVLIAQARRQRVPAMAPLPARSGSSVVCQTPRTCAGRLRGTVQSGSNA